ncbi:MAG: hypothetical protein V3T83_16540 [Acidobacteriota bacterium]
MFAARLDPVEGSEQAGIRPVVLVSRDAPALTMAQSPRGAPTTPSGAVS